MEIRRIGENKIRCALTEDEIREMGFEIDDIIADGETIQKFMKVVLRRVEQEENISLEHVSPVVRAELLPDHSMAITFGGDSDMSFKGLMDTINRMVSRLDPEKIKDFSKLPPEEKQAMIREFVDSMEEAEASDGKSSEKPGQPEAREEKSSAESRAKESMTCALRFTALEDIAAMSRGCFADQLPKSSLYKLEGAYFLMLDFTGIAREEMRSFAFCALEYDQGHYSDDRQLAYIAEHGTCLIKKEAIETLMQL